MVGAIVVQDCKWTVRFSISNDNCCVSLIVAAGHGTLSWAVAVVQCTYIRLSVRFCARCGKHEQGQRISRFLGTNLGASGMEAGGSDRERTQAHYLGSRDPAHSQSSAAHTRGRRSHDNDAR